METPRSYSSAARMTPQRWQQIKPILADAIECDGALQREALVESSCAGDSLLRQEVEALLAYADSPTKIGDNGHAPHNKD